MACPILFSHIIGCKDFVMHHQPAEIILLIDFDYP
jgi:hypothetical protein